LWSMIMNEAQLMCIVKICGRALRIEWLFSLRAGGKASNQVLRLRLAKGMAKPSVYGRVDQ
jgi:hypothetical protein